MANAPGQHLPAHLSSDTQIHVIVSVLSGTQQAQSYYDDKLIPCLKQHGIQYQTHTTRSTQTIIELTQDVFLSNARKGIKQTIILLSGDGGMIDIINTLASNISEIASGQPIPDGFVKPVVCLVPQGTANALAWSSKVASNPLDVMLQGHPKSIPMFQVKFSTAAKLVANEGADLEEIPSVRGSNDGPLLYGAVVCSWGLHASLVARSDTKEYRKHGLERFRMAAGELLEENHAYDGTIKIKVEGSDHWQPIVDTNTDSSNNPTPCGSELGSSPGSTHHHQHLNDDDDDEPTSTSLSPSTSDKSSYLAVLLVSNLEQNYCISPHHLPLSPIMHVVFLSHRPKSEIGELTFLPYQNGKHVDDARVVYKQIQALRIEVNEQQPSWREVCVDGKIVQLEKGGWAEVSRLGDVSVVDLVVPTT